MAHNLYEIDGITAFASAKEKAWHGLGQVLPEVMTSEECIREAQLDYEVGLCPVIADMYNQFQDSNGQRQNPAQPNYHGLLDVGGKFATYNKSTRQVYGVVGSKYTVIQNKDAFRFFDEIVGKGEAMFETAGALGKGETIFITAKLPSYLRIGNSDDVVENYLLLTMSHDGTSAIKAMYTPTRVVCNNTLGIALKNGTNKISIRHTANAQEKLNQASKLMNITFNAQAMVGNTINAMANTKMNDEATKLYIDKLFMTGEEFNKINVEKATRNDILSTRKMNIIDEIQAYTFGDSTQQLNTTKGTVWGAYNGITGYYQNSKSFKSDEDKMKSNLLGSNYNVMAKAYQLAEELS